MDWFLLANESMRLSQTGEILSNGRIRKRVISDFEPVIQVIVNTNKCIRKSKGIDDYSSSNIISDLWNLKQSVTHAVVGFDSNQLGLAAQLEKLLSQAVRYPSLSDEILSIEKSIKYLITNPKNPKELILNELIEEFESKGIEFGMIFPPADKFLTGWSDLLRKIIISKSSKCIIIDSRKSLLTKNFNDVILASGGRYLRYMSDLLHSGSCINIHTITYDKEATNDVNERKLPKGTVNFASDYANKKYPQNISSETDDISNWLDEEYWDMYNPQDIGSKEYDIDNDYLVKAKLVALSGECFVYLKDGKKTIEISDIVHKRKGLDDIEKKDPTKLVNDLEDGDYLLLRTDAVGDYLHEVVEKLLKEDNLSDLKDSALSWKPYLTKALKKYGAVEIQRRLALEGHKLSVKNYVWSWTTEEVISPENESRFFELIRILADLNELPEIDNIADYTTQAWNKMLKLKKYHRRAGAEIRKMLLKKLKDSITSGIEISDGYELKLPGADSGTMTVYRVSGVDPRSHQVPFKELDSIKRAIRKNG